MLAAGEQGKEKPEEGPIPEVPDAEKMPTPTDDEELKRMGDAAYLIEEIPLERRLPRRIDFQVPSGKFNHEKMVETPTGLSQKIYSSENLFFLNIFS